MRIFLLALSALNLLWVHPLYAQTVNNSASLSIPMDNDLDSARSAVLGPAYVAVADDGAALFWNPAGLGQLSSGELSLHYQDWISQTSLDTLLVALPMPGWGGVGLAAHYMDYGTFAGRDASGTPTASFSADRIALEGGWGYPLDETLSIGLGTRASQQNLAGNNYTDLSFDGGLLYRASTELTLALAFSGLGESGAQGDLPFTLNMGVAYRPELSRDWALLLCGAGSIEQANLTGLQTGAEAVYQGHYALRAGLRIDFVDNQWDGFSGLTLGAGYRLEGLSIDYAFLPMGELGTSNLISLSYHFQAVNLETAKDAGSAVQAPATKPLPVKIASTVQPPSTPTATPTSEPADTHGTPQTGSTGSATDGPPALPFGAAISSPPPQRVLAKPAAWITISPCRPGPRTVEGNWKRKGG